MSILYSMYKIGSNTARTSFTEFPSGFPFDLRGTHLGGYMKKWINTCRKLEQTISGLEHEIEDKQYILSILKNNLLSEISSSPIYNGIEDIDFEKALLGEQASITKIESFIESYFCRRDYFILLEYSKQDLEAQMFYIAIGYAGFSYIIAIPFKATLGKNQFVLYGTRKNCVSDVLVSSWNPYDIQNYFWKLPDRSYIDFTKDMYTKESFILRLS